ncbi:MAG: extra-cytoplasmic solute receptor protein [Rhizobacter sp.]|nr:extra-cytoplasmic solute receptor protein [Rhizobacter sp.]
MLKKLITVVVALVASCAGVAASAADFPSRTVRFIVPLAAGSATDILARQIAHWLEDDWKQPVIVENRPGGGGLIAANYVINQPADGYTLLMAGSSFVIAPFIDQNVGTRFDTALYPVARLAVLRVVLATNTGVPAQTLQDFAALTRAKAGTMNYAGLGRTSIIDTGLEVLKQGLAMNLTPVAYKGASDHITALIRNDVQLVWGGAIVMKGQLATGKVRILSTVADHRFTDLPDVPSLTEAGYTGFIPQVWTGLIAPTATPPATLAQINRDVNRILARPEAIELLRNVLGNDPAPMPAGEFAAAVKQESKFWGAMFKALGIEPE